MSKQIKFEKNGENYVLEYNREAIKLMEQKGFVVTEMANKPMTMLPLAFEGLFYKNHKKVKKEFVDECYDNFSNKTKLIEAIGEMLAESYETLTEDKDNKQGNIEWEIVG